MRALLVTLLILGVIGYRFVKIVEKGKKKADLAESVTVRSVWDIALPDHEFMGDQSQVGTWMLYTVGDQFFARDLGRGTVTAVSHPPALPSHDSRTIGLSASGKKSFHIETENGHDVVAQYNVKSHARGLLARFPETCHDHQARQQLRDGFFAIEASCSSHRRIFVMNLEDRRVTYASPLLPVNAHLRAFR